MRSQRAPVQLRVCSSSDPYPPERNSNVMGKSWTQGSAVARLSCVWIVVVLNVLPAADEAIHGHRVDCRADPGRDERRPRGGEAPLGDEADVLATDARLLAAPARRLTLEIAHLIDGQHQIVRVETHNTPADLANAFAEALVQSHATAISDVERDITTRRRRGLRIYGRVRVAPSE